MTNTVNSVRCPYCNSITFVFGVLSFLSPLLVIYLSGKIQESNNQLYNLASMVPIVNLIAQRSTDPWIAMWSLSFSILAGFCCGLYVALYVGINWSRVNPVERFNTATNRVTSRTILFGALIYLFFLWQIAGDYIRAIMTDIGYTTNSLIFHFLPPALGVISGFQAFSDATKETSMISFFYYAPYDTSALMLASCAEFFYMVLSVTMLSLSAWAFISTLIFFTRTR